MAIVQHQISDKTTRRTLTVEVAARLLGIGRATAYAAARSGELPVVRVGGRVLVPRARLEALLGEDLPAEGGEPIEETSGPAATTSAGGRGDVTTALEP